MGSVGIRVGRVEEATVARWRMHSQRLWGARATGIGDALGALAASQGQDLLPSAWALAQRVPTGTVTEQDVLAAYDAGTIVRTHLLRPTWHFVHPADLRWLLRATAPRVHRVNGTVYRRWGFDERVLATIRTTIVSALSDGQHLTRKEIGAALAGAGLELAGQGLAYALMFAELEGLICSGARRGKQHTYALLEQRVRGSDDRSRPQTLAELARRYFTARGPASVRDLAGWASLTLTEATQATRDAAHGLESFIADDTTYWHAPGQPPPAADEPRADLINGLDELVMSYTQTRTVLTGGRPWGQGTTSDMYHAVLIDGRLAGHWTYRRNGHGRPMQIPIHPLRDWTSDEHRAVDEAIARFERFVGHPVERA